MNILELNNLNELVEYLNTDTEPLTQIKSFDIKNRFGLVEYKHNPFGCLFADNENVIYFDFTTNKFRLSTYKELGMVSPDSLHHHAVILGDASKCYILRQVKDEIDAARFINESKKTKLYSLITVMKRYAKVYKTIKNKKKIPMHNLTWTRYRSMESPWFIVVSNNAAI